MIKMNVNIALLALLITQTHTSYSSNIPQNYMMESNNIYDLQLPMNSRLNITVPPSWSRDFKRVTVRIPSEERQSNMFLTVQIHTRYKTLSMSFTKTYDYANTYNSSNPGILKQLLDAEDAVDVYVGSNDTTPVQSLMVAIGYQNTPIPGGCCLTCALEIDPNIEMSYQNGKADLFFHRASQYYPIGSTLQCDNSNPQTYRLQYTVYYHYISDFSSESFFDAIWRMSRPDNIRKYGTAFKVFTGRSLLRLSYQPIKGQGVVFNVIVYDPQSHTSSAYIPIASYHCHFTGPSTDCYIKKDVTSIVYCVFCAIIGIALLVTGIKLLHLLFFITGWLFYWLFIYVTLYRLYVDAADDLSRSDGMERDVMIMSSMIAICGGALTLFFYAFQKFLVLSFLTLGVFTSIFITSIIFYTPIGHLSFWDGNDKFLFAFGCISICFTTFFFFLPKFLCIFSSSMIGSYAVILVPNYFFNGTLQYIVLVAVLRLSSSPDFFLEHPYCMSDYILSGTWVLLFIIGITIQYYLSRNENMELSGLYLGRNPLNRMNETGRMNNNNNINTSNSMDYHNDSSLYTPDERTPLFYGNHQQQQQYSSQYDGSTSSGSQSFVNSNSNSIPTAPPQRPPSPPPPYTTR